MTDIKLNDVYSFKYDEEYLKKHKIFSPYHCFDGQLIVKDYDGELRLKDTFYSNSESFTLAELENKGTLTFKCNLDDVVSCNESDKMYYAEGDVIDLSYQHGCYKSFVRKKDAKRSKDVMCREIGKKMKEINDSVSHKLYDYARLYHLKELVERGEDLDKIYIPVLV